MLLCDCHQYYVVLLPSYFPFIFHGKRVVGGGGKLLNTFYRSNFCWLTAFALKKRLTEWSFAKCNSSKEKKNVLQILTIKIGWLWKENWSEAMCQTKTLNCICHFLFVFGFFAHSFCHVLGCNLKRLRCFVRWFVKDPFMFFGFSYSV